MKHTRSLSLDALIDASEFLATGRLRKVRRDLGNSTDAKVRDAASRIRATGMSEAQRLRDEWRRQRYSRLKSN